MKLGTIILQLMLIISSDSANVNCLRHSNRC